jgi:hypothetical protein
LETGMSDKRMHEYCYLACMIAESARGRPLEQILLEAEEDGCDEDEIIDLWTAIERFNQHLTGRTKGAAVSRLDRKTRLRAMLDAA